MLRMALLFLNPSDQRHAPLGSFVIRSLRTATTTFPVFVGDYLQHHLLAVLRFIYYQVYIYLPCWVEYQVLRFWYWCRWLHLTWLWWTVLISSYWNEPPPRKNGKFNGTYWMHVCEDLHQLRRCYQDLERSQSRFCWQPCFQNFYEDFCPQFWRLFIMGLLHFSAFWYFVGQIFLYRLGWLHNDSK